MNLWITSDQNPPVFCATCNEHSLRRHKKTGVNDGDMLCCHQAVAVELAWQPAVAAVVAAAVVVAEAAVAQAYPLLLSLSSSTLLVLLDGFVLPLLFLQATTCPPSTRNGWLMFALVVHCPLCHHLPFQQSSIVVLPAAGRRRILSLLCRRRLAPSLLFGPPRHRRCCHCGVIVIVDAALARWRHPTRSS